MDAHKKKVTSDIIRPPDKSVYLKSVFLFLKQNMGAQWLSGRVLDSRPNCRGFELHRRNCIVSLSKNIYPSLVLVQPRKTRLFTTERLLMGHKKSNQPRLLMGRKKSNQPKHMLWVLKRTV